jgi:hypothetical protein
MNEPELTGAWIALEPTAPQRRRIDARVRGWLDASEVSLAGEWIALLKVNPIARLGFATVAAILVLFVTPLSWMAFAAV